MSVTCVLFQLPNIFVHPQSTSDYRYHSFGELASFTYCFLQKIKQGSSLLLVKQWEQYELANHSKFPPFSDEDFLSGTRVLAALNKIWSSYLKRVFRRDSCRFLEEFTISVLAAVAARCNIGQGLNCFCPAIVFGGDNQAPLHLLGLLLDGLWEQGWIKGKEIEACRAEYQSLVQEQRQLERSSTKSRPDIGEVLPFCSLQADFCAHQHLFKVCILTNRVKPFHRSSRK